MSTRKLARLAAVALLFGVMAGLNLPGCPWFPMMKYQQSRDGFSYDTDDYNAPGPKRQSMRLPVPGTVPIDGGDPVVTLLDADQKLVIDFKRKKGHRMDPVFCVSSMDVLPAKHILARKETEAAKVKELVEENPVQLVIATLSAYPGKAASARARKRSAAVFKTGPSEMRGGLTSRRRPRRPTTIASLQR